MAITDNVKDILAIKIKPRQDSYTDQFCRILMVKVMMLGTMLVGLTWYFDRMTCIISGSAGIDGGFVSSACWINGVYIYKDIKHHANDVGYYGIPRDINNDGMANGEICSTTDTSHRRRENCIGMEKTFYLQYQYMTFLLLGFVLIYYLPYVLFCYVNKDMKALGESITNGASADDIVGIYFNERGNSRRDMRLRLLGNLIVKLLYIVVSVAAFDITDRVLLGEFRHFGSEWTSWANLANPMAYDYMGVRPSPKAGDVVFPTFGLCEVHESAQDIKYVVTNKHRFICEMSQHVLYQYVFVIIWFAMVASISVSSVGFVLQITSHVLTEMSFRREGGRSRQMYKKLAMRQCEYLEFLQQKNMPLYNAVLSKLIAGLFHMVSEKRCLNESSYV